MLSQTDEPPGSNVYASRLKWSETDRTSVRNIAVLSNELFPKNYLAIEGYRLCPFTIEVKPLFNRYQQHLQVTLSDYTFANNIIWLSRMSAFYQIIEDCFCLFSLNGNCLTMLLPPLGDPSRQARALEVCFEIMDSYNPSPYLSTVEYVYRDFLTVLNINANAESGEDGLPALTNSQWLVERALPDYIYSTEDLIELKGNPYKTKRGEINQFRRSYPDHRLEVLGPQHWEGIRALMDTWLKNRIKYLNGDAIADFFYTVEMERKAIERAIEHYGRLDLQGLCLFIGDTLEGFTFGERITSTVASVLVEKTNFAILGSAQFLFREFAKMYRDCVHINVGDDLGLENLRRVKMSYRPVLFGEKFTLRHLAEGGGFPS
ncbi:MAG: phosphatidylglycerol lysyltransferase domain-containing protein [Gammaproteobacteria bacterium]